MRLIQITFIAIFLMPLGLLGQKHPAPTASGITFGGPRAHFDYPYVDNTEAPCAYDEIRNKKMQDPAYKKQLDVFEREIRKRVGELRASAREETKATVYTIPVVFHVMHMGETVGTGHNIPAVQITSSVAAMNRDYRRLSSDGGIALGTGPDIEVEFCLATTDPSGNPTNGILRVNASGTANYANIGIDEDVNGSDIKALSKWPTKDYVNVWVVREINDQGEYGSWAGGTVGYAYPVSSSPNTNPNTNPTFNPGDGIVVANFGLGNDPDQSEGWNIYSNLKLNRVMTHEMGHHLNLLHPFNDNSCVESDCSTDGDYVCDTPPTTLNSNCNSPACSGTQIVENYMDYTGESCVNMFTAGQKLRMRAVLEGFSRNSLTQSTGCSSSFASADFEADVTTAAVSETITFTDLSTASPALTTWSWNFGDGNSSTQQNPTHSYATGGFKTVALTVGNGSDSDTETKIDYIFVSEEATGTLGGNCDTLRNYTDAELETVTTYSSAGDPVPGIGGDSFEGFAERFENTGTYVFQDFIIAIQRIDDLGAPSNVTFNVYDDAGNGPGNIVASGSLPFSALTAGSFNRISFAEPIEVTDNFYVGWEHAATTDTMAVFGTQFRDNEYNSVFLKQDGAWYVFQDPANFSMALATIPYKDFSLELQEDNNLYDHCEGTELSFSAVNPLNFGQYAWTFDGANSSSDANPNFSFSGKGDHTVALTVTGRCGGTETSSIQVFSYEAPDITANINNADCASQNGWIKVSHGGTEDMSYQWVNTNNQTDSIGDLAPGDYQLVVTNGACEETYTYTVAENALSVNASFYKVDPTCEENNGIVAVIMEREGNFEYFWNGSLSPGADTLFDLGPGAYAVDVSENGCPVASEQTTLVNIGLKPNVDFTLVDTLFLGDSYTITSLSSGAGAHNYSFSDGQASQSGEDVTVTFNQLGDVEVTLVITNAENCTDSLKKTVYIKQTVGINALTLNQFKIYPNPSQGQIVAAALGATIITEVQVLDMLGKIVYTKSNTSSTAIIDLDGQCNGYYILKLQTDKGNINTKISLIR